MTNSKTSPTTLGTPWVIDTSALEKQLGDQGILVVDMTSPATYAQVHVPGAVFLNYADVVQHAPPVMGMLPDSEQFSQALSHAGITPDTYVVAYDDEGGGKAARFMWTLDVIGHKKMSLLDGGIHAWLKDNKPRSTEAPNVEKSHYPVSFNHSAATTNAEAIMENLSKDNFRVLDTRSRNEFSGADKRAARVGHIPGAVNLDWLDIKSPENAQRLKPAKEIEQMLADLGLSPEQEIVTHCHSHHRSALTYVALKSLGYHNIKGYPGSWSDWGNRDDTPIKT